MSTISYYDKYAINYFLDTYNIDMHTQYELFEKYIKKDSKLLDFGCGSGRDIRYFSKKGYDICGIDGSKELSDIASNFTLRDVRNINFNDFNDIELYDGIWSCASLYHLNNKELLEVLLKIRNALKDNGIVYASLKDGNSEEIDNYGRYYNYIRKDDFVNLSFDAGLETIDCLKTKTKREERNWNNFILRKMVK